MNQRKRRKNASLVCGAFAVVIMSSLLAFDIVGLGPSAHAGVRASLPFLDDKEFFEDEEFEGRELLRDKDRIIREAASRDDVWIPDRAIPSVPVTPKHTPTRKPRPTATATPTKKPAKTPRWKQWKHRKHHRPSTRPMPVPSPTRPGTPAPTDRATGLEREVWRLINAARTERGCAALRYDSRIARAARLHSQDMARNGYFEHDSLDGRSPWDRMRAQGYDAPGAENIAAGQRTPQAAVRAWMSSSGHRANILDCDLKATGVGVAFGGRYGIYWTQDFGRE